MVTDGRFRGDEGEARLASAGQPDRPDVLLLGGGEDVDPEESVRRAAGLAVRRARAQRAKSLAFAIDQPTDPVWEAAAEGLSLGDWSYDELRGDEGRAKRPAALEQLVLYRCPDGPSDDADGQAAVRRGSILAAAQNTARRLVTQPGNIVTPAYLADHAEQLGKRFGLRVETWDAEKLRAEGFGALLAVARGSAQEPRFVIIEYRGVDEDPFVLVGKGVTFDSGGISLKPASGMEAMKYDMAGAAAVLGAIEGLARLQLPRRVIGLIPTTENLPSGTALKPGDVVKGLSGASIEVVNTDAEGRLILSDALSFACRLNPQAIVDLATLTGACVVALGHHAIGLMASDDDLAAAVEAAGGRCGERVWRLPLWPAYKAQLDSDIADVKNSGGRPAATITAGLFLERFVSAVPWAHLDIAGTAWADEEGAYQPKGATGVGVRLLVEWLRGIS
jgi:leucyl aminopeptidase